MNWWWLNSGPGEAAFNMALDEALLESVGKLGAPVLRFYGWTQPAATFGYFQHYAEIERTTLLRPLIRRPTGGGQVRTTRTGLTASRFRRAMNGMSCARKPATAVFTNGFSAPLRNWEWTPTWPRVARRPPPASVSWAMSGMICSGTGVKLPGRRSVATNWDC